MKRDEFDAIVDTMRRFVEGGEKAQRAVEKLAPAAKEPALVGVVGGLNPEQVERLYQMFKARFIDEARLDPILLQLMTVRPEIVVEVEPRIVTLEGSTQKGRIARLIAAGWFKEPRKVGTVRQELARTGPDPGGGGTLGDNLAALQRDGFLVFEGGGYAAAPGVKITDRTLETV